MRTVPDFDLITKRIILNGQESNNLPLAIMIAKAHTCGVFWIVQFVEEYFFHLKKLFHFQPPYKKGQASISLLITWRLNVLTTEYSTKFACGLFKCERTHVGSWETHFCKLLSFSPQFRNSKYKYVCLPLGSIDV